MTLHLIYPRQTLENSNAFLTFRAYDYSSAPQVGAGNIRSAVQRSAGDLSSVQHLNSKVLHVHSQKQ